MKKKSKEKFATKPATNTFKKSIKDMVQYQKKHEPRYVEDTKRPYISWYAFDEATNKFIRVKQELRKGTTELEIKNKMQEIRFAQIDGKVYAKPQPREINPNPKKKKAITLQKCVDNFLKIKNLELKYGSNRSYKSHLGLFLEWCNAKKHFFVKDITTTVVKEYLLHSLEIGNSNKNRNNKRAMLRGFFNYLKGENIIKENPVNATLKIKEDKTQITAFQKEHLKIMWANFKLQNLPLYYFTKIIFHAFIRPAELAQLKIGDIDFTTKKITIDAKISKTNLGRVSITPPLHDILKELIGDRKPNQFLFEKTPNEPYSEKWFSDKFRTYRIKEQYPETYKLYCFKHTGVREHFLAGNAITFIQRQCRHSEIATTFHYLQVGLGLDINNNEIYIEPMI